MRVMADAPSDAEAVDLPVLLSQAARGDERAWREIVRLYGRRVFALARSRCKDDDLAEEISQSVFVTVATTLQQGAYAEKGRFESWLFRIVMNRVRDEVRRRSRHAAPTDPTTLAESRATVDEPERGGDERELRQLRAAMEQLSDADREVVELRHHGQMSFKAIADLLGAPMGTVLARHHRALHKLKELIGETDAESE